MAKGVKPRLGRRPKPPLGTLPRLCMALQKKEKQIKARKKQLLAKKAGRVGRKRAPAGKTKRARSQSPTRAVLDDAPLGPRDRREVLRIVEAQVESLGPQELRRVVEKFADGLWVDTEYSGMAMPEYFLRRLQSWLEVHGHNVNLSFGSSGDLLEHARAVLLEVGKSDECVFGDMTEKLPGKIKKKFVELIALHAGKQKQDLKGARSAKQRKEVKRASERAFLAAVKEVLTEEMQSSAASDFKNTMSYCFRHRRLCLTNKPHKRGIKLRVAGISCIDWSTRGSRLGTLGKGILAWLTFIREVMLDQPDVAVVECTKHYAHEDIEIVTGELYALSFAVFSSAEVGPPAERWRKYMVLINKNGRLRWRAGREMSRERIFDVFGRTCFC